MFVNEALEYAKLGALWAHYRAEAIVETPKLLRALASKIEMDRDIDEWDVILDLNSYMALWENVKDLRKDMDDYASKKEINSIEH